jgi:hypothetical protein
VKAETCYPLSKKIISSEASCHFCRNEHTREFWSLLHVSFIRPIDITMNDPGRIAFWLLSDMNTESRRHSIWTRFAASHSGIELADSKALLGWSSRPGNASVYQDRIIYYIDIQPHVPCPRSIVPGII